MSPQPAKRSDSDAVEIPGDHRAASSGSVRVLWMDPAAGGRRRREWVGIVLQSDGIGAELTVRETISLCAGFCARPPEVAEANE